MSQNGYKTYIFYSCTEELVDVEETNLYILECDIESHRSILEDGTVTYCYITDVTDSYVSFLVNFEQEMINMQTEERKIELSEQFSKIIKENIKKVDRCVYKDLEIMNRLFIEHMDTEVKLDILEGVRQL